MTALYNCKSEIDQWGGLVYRITKFDSDMNVQSSYRCNDIQCECPAMGRLTCRHREMLPKFIAREAVNTHWFYDFDRGGWVSTEPHLEGAVPSTRAGALLDENDCPGHVASANDPKICGRCGTHIDSLRPDDEPVFEARSALCAPSTPQPSSILRRF